MNVSKWTDSVSLSQPTVETLNTFLYVNGPYSWQFAPLSQHLFFLVFHNKGPTKELKFMGG